LAAIEYSNNGLKFDRAHNKQRKIWGELHRLREDEPKPDLANYSLLVDDASVIAALQKGFKQAQAILRVLNMAPSTVAKDKMVSATLVG
jgi:hypothetical protein